MGRRLFKTRTGFTLLELMASLVLTSMLLVTLMGLTARLTSSSQQLKEKYPDIGWLAPVRGQMEIDFQNSRAVVLESNRFSLEGYGIPTIVLDEPSGCVGHVPVAIEYRVEDINGEVWLTRTEVRLDVSPPGNRSKTLVCNGVVGFEAVKPLETDVAPPVFGVRLLFADGYEVLQLVRHGVASE